MALLNPNLELGNIKDSWTEAYFGQKAFFVNNTVIVYACGSNIKFYNIETKETTSFLPPNVKSESGANTISLLTANNAINKFAFSETQLSPKVYIYDYGSTITEQSVLQDGTAIEYLMIEFSNSDAILTLSGVPDLQIIIWNLKNGHRITTINLNQTQMIPEFVCFSPTNWRHVTVAYKNEINIWKLEQFNEERVKAVNTRFILPPTDDNKIEPAVGAEFKDEFIYPNNAITNLNDKYGAIIDEVLDKRQRHSFKSICWTNVDEVLISTNENCIFKYSLNDSSIKCILKPNENKDNKFDLNKGNVVNKMFLHRQGLFATCSDGMIRILDGAEVLTVNKKSEDKSSAEVIKMIDACSNFISNLSFNSKYSHLAISTNRGIQLLDCEKLFHNDHKSEKELITLNNKNENRIELIINYDSGRVLGVSSLNPSSDHFIVLKEHGAVQIWNIKKKQIISRVFLNRHCSHMATHPSMPLVAIGTAEGSIIFIDITDVSNPRLLENCFIHKKQVKRLRFNSAGTVLFSVGDDNKVYLIDVRISPKVESILMNKDQRLVTNFVSKDKFIPGLYLLGYLEYDGEATCIDTFDFVTEESQEKKTITTRVIVGLHDQNSWEVTRKSMADSPQSVLSTLDSKAPSYQQTSQNHNLLMQNVQTEPVISRLNYVDSSAHPNYDSNNQQDKVKLSSKILVFDFNFSIFEDKSRVYATKRLDFKDDIINKSIFHTHYLFSDLVLASRNNLVTFSDRFLTKYFVPDYEPNRRTTSKQVYLDLNDIVGAHDFGYGCFSKTNNNQFLISGGFDGLISIRRLADPKSFIETKGPHYLNGGCQMAKFHNDIFSLIVVGYDNTVNSLNWTCPNESLSRLAKQPTNEGDCEKSALARLESNYKLDVSDVTWYELKEKDFFKEQDEQFLPIKKEIMDGLEEIKLKLKELMETNQSREDLAKLKEHEFYLDLEELERLHKEADSEILKIRDKTEFDNLSKMFIREKIKKECWEEMKVKGRGIQAFNSNLLVENYSLKDRTPDEIKYLENIKMIRRIEMMAQKTRSELTADIMSKEGIHELAELDEEEQKEADTGSNASGQNANNYLTPNLTQLSYKGSIGPLFNGDSNLFYHQFELFTREQKWIQILLIQDALFRIKENFNKEFELIMQRKQQEIAKIKEKNQRLKQIYIDLNEEKQLLEPQLGDAENPEVLFEVKDDEIRVEKYLTAEQRKLLEEQLAEEAKRRELEKLDNWRERGLMDMMSGVLQIRREDELKKDVPVPPFVKEKPQEEWTPEEQKLFQVYEQKVKELNEERDKLKKHLNSEINKINEQILECFQNFDNVLLGLHLRKVKTQQAIFQEELKIVRLFNSLVIDSELETYEHQLNHKLEKLKEQKKEITQEIQHLKKALDSSKEEFDILSAEDKSQEKAFAREFSDVSPGVRDQLLRLFKKRARQRMTINKTNLNPAPVHIPEFGADNPFSDRPSTAQQINLYDVDTEAALIEFDNFDSAPPGVDQSIWERFIIFRRNKIAMENTLRIKGLNISEMSLYMQKRMEEDEHKRKEIDECNKNILAVQDMRLKANHNLQIQLLMKQGQVEIDPGPYVHNFENCLLINRNVVESLNKVIQAHGKQKISIMVDSKDFRKGIRQLEWEHRKMKMTIEDYITKQRDITYLKLTREVQEFLNTEDYDGKKQKEISVLEQTLAYQAKQYEKVYNLKSKKVKEIKNQSIKVANENDQFDDKLTDANISLHDRRHITEEITGKTIETIRQEKFQQIIQRRKLVDLAKAQAQEVAFLRSEVERLRMKTFPALVQIEF